MGIGDWGLGIGPNPQSPIPNPQSPIPIPILNERKYLIIYFNLNTNSFLIDYKNVLICKYIKLLILLEFIISKTKNNRIKFNLS